MTPANQTTTKSPRSKLKSLTLAILPLIYLGMTPYATAATVYWDGADTTSGNGAPIGGSGNWNTSNNWTNDAAGTTNQAWVDGDNAVFGGTGGTVTLDTAQTIGDITFNSDGYTLESSNLSRAVFFANPINTYTVTNAGDTATIDTIVGMYGGTSPNALIKQGDGKLILSSFKNYNGDTTISAGTLESIGGPITGNVINNGTYIINVATNSGNYYSSSISGTGDLVKTGGGAQYFNSANTYTGRTLLSEGTIQTGNLSALGNNSAVTVDGGRLQISSGNLNIGSLAGSGGEVTIDSGQTLSTGADNTSTTYSGVIAGSGNLTKQGSGSFILAGNNTYTGITTVNGGTLSVNGSIANSTTTVNSSGTLGGTGTVGDVFINGGTFAPGNSIGTINVSGNVDFTGNGQYDVEVDAAGNNDKIIATGSATLTSGVVNVIAAAGTYADATDYTILTATGGLGGTTFDSVNANLAFLTPTLSYDANNVFLRLTRNDVSFNDVASTRNQRAVATTIDNNTSQLTELVSQFTPLSSTDAQKAFDSVSGVQHSNNQIISRSVSSQFNQLLLNQSSQSASGSLAFNNQMNASGMNSGSASEMPQQRGWWLQGFGSFNEIDDTHNARGADFNTSGLALGIDADWHDVVIGVAGSYANTDVDAYQSNSTIDSYQAAVYGSWQADEVYINASLGLGLHRVDASRKVIIGSSVSTAKADYDSIDVNGSIESGKDFAIAADTTLTPFAGVTYLHNSREDFNERGAGAANLNVDRENDESLLTAVGLRLSHDIHMKDDRILTPVASIAYVHEHMDSLSQLDASFNGVPAASFVIDSPDLDKNRLQLELGLSGQLSEKTRLTVGYYGEYASTHQNNAFTATVNMDF